MEVLPLDSFIVINHTFLNDQNREVLSLLYQPIMGSIAFNLYVTLWGFIGNENINHYDIVNTMQIKLEDICKAREKLEALGLLKTYVKKGDLNEYIYELYSPLTAYEFINNPILDTSLFNNVGKKAYENIVNKFSIPNINLSEYKDISKTFRDVFSFTQTKRINNKNIVKVKHLGLDFEPTIDLREVLGNIPSELIDYKSIDSNTRMLIYQLALVYGYDNKTMTMIIEDSLGCNKKIEPEVLKTNCRNYYKFENKNHVPAIVDREQPYAWRSNTNGGSKLDLYIKELEEASPKEFLTSKNGGCEPTRADLKLIEYLLIDLNLKPGVVNVLIDYVLRINNNKLNKAYVEKIASQWIRCNINTVADAINIAKGENKKKTKQQSKKLPDWLDKEIKSDLMSEEELRAFEKELGVGIND